ncbi:hypothetical protein, partial [Shigella sonnei]|uniref:hypothetical protein n=1 Tax=Shigella sonnei TaxID=624 RepID=UPI001C0A7CCE
LHKKDDGRSEPYQFINHSTFRGCRVLPRPLTMMRTCIRRTMGVLSRISSSIIRPFEDAEFYQGR